MAATWNPAPTTGGANWAGNTQLATRNQLLSTSTGLYDEFSAFNFSTLNVSTLTVPIWISTPLLYVSDIKGYRVDVSGISSQTANFNLVTVSSIGFTAPSVELHDLVKVNVDFNLGEILYNALAGTGTLIFQTLVGLGVGLGGFFYGIGNGISAMIDTKDPTNPTIINSNYFEVMGGSTQIQVSTLGYAYPAYSSIMRYVSSAVPNAIPGRPIFTSTIFYPGQICVRSISDPYPLVTSISSVFGSTIQQFGEWVPLEGLEPENMVGNSLSTNFISSGFIFTGDIHSFHAAIKDLDTNQVNIADYVPSANPYIQLGYETPLNMTIGNEGNARLLGGVNNFWIQSPDTINFSKPGAPESIPIAASLAMGTNGNESLLTVSSIFSRGNIQAKSGFFSSLTVEQLTVVSSFSTIYNVTASNILSTSLVEAYLVSTINLQAQYITPFTFSSILGIPNGPFDITRTDNVVSTTYNQISSLQQNILNYSLNISVQDETNFNIGDNPGIGLTYEVTPANIQQWASTQIIFNGYQGPGGIDLGWVGQWGVSPGQTTQAAPGGATFDVLYAPSPVVGLNAPFYLTEQSNKAYPAGVSTFYQQSNPNLPTPVTFTARMTLPPVIGGSRSGWWQMTTPAPPPYSTSNNNTFQIYQDINDTYIQTTDRLHLRGGDIFLEGKTTFSNAQYVNLQATSFTASNIFASNVFTPTAYISTLSTGLILADPTKGGFESYYLKSTFSYNTQPQAVYPLNLTFQSQTQDFTNIYNLLAPFQGSNLFNSYNYTWWNNSMFDNSVQYILGVPAIFCGDINQPLGPYAAQFWINNAIVSPAYALPVYYINSAGSNLLGLIPGNNYALVTTADGINWSINTNVPNPQGNTKTNYVNSLSMVQATSNTQLVASQPLQVQAPQVNMVTEVFNLYGDQIRVNSHRYGSLPTSGLPSFPIGFQTGTYVDPNISWTQQPQASGLWQSDATNVIYGISQLYFDVNSYRMIIIPSRFRTNSYPIYSWDVQVTILPVSGGGYCWGYSRYIQIADGPSGPGINTTDNWNEWLAIPNNYCTY